MKHAIKSLLYIIMIISIGLNFTACINTPKPKKHIQQTPVEPVLSEEEKYKQYKIAMRKVGMSIKQDYGYQKLDLSTPELKSWFTDLTYKVWDHQITQGEFIISGLDRFPRHSYEFEVISNGLLESQQ